MDNMNMTVDLTNVIPMLPILQVCWRCFNSAHKIFNNQKIHGPKLNSLRARECDIRIFFSIPPSSFDSWNWLAGLSGSSGFRCMYVYIYICNTVSLLAAHFTIYGTLMANNEIKNIINTTLPRNMSHDASTCTLA